MALVATIALVTPADAGTAPSSLGGIGIQAYECPGGYSCYYDSHDGHDRIWIAPSCGFFDLGAMGLNDRISSVLNDGSGDVRLYNWDGVGSWVQIAYVAVGRAGNLYSNLDNVTDGVSIDC